MPATASDSLPAAKLTGGVLLADDHPAMRKGLALTLSQEFGASKFVYAGTFDEAMAGLDAPDLQLAIFDLGMPGLAGPHALIAVRQKRPDVRLVVYTGSSARDDMLDSLAAGVHGYVVKTEHESILTKCLARVLAGDIYVPPRLADLHTPAMPRDLRHGANQGDNESADARLSKRQREVLLGLIEGLTNKQIARRMGLSEGTIKMHIASLFGLLGVTSRTQAAVLGKDLLDH
jgi:DNA-binding NarL/FixJ family response regulator